MIIVLLINRLKLGTVLTTIFCFCCFHPFVRLTKRRRIRLRYTVMVRRFFSPAGHTALRSNISYCASQCLPFLIKVRRYFFFLIQWAQGWVSSCRALEKGQRTRHRCTDFHSYVLCWGKIKFPRVSGCVVSSLTLYRVRIVLHAGGLGRKERGWE